MDDYRWWREALETKTFTVNENTPESGFYKTKRGGAWVPVAIWKVEGEPVAVVGKDRQRVAPADIWVQCAKHPVSKEDGKHAFATGAWPGDIPATGHNSGTLSIAEEIADVCASAMDWLRKIGAVKTKEQSDTAANWRAKLNELKKRADADRETEKRPHLEASRAVDAKFKPVIEQAETAANSLRDALTVFMRAEDAKARAEAEAKHKAEQERVRAERERIAAEQAALMEKDPIAALTTLPPPEPELPIFEAPAPIQAGGQRGRKTGLRTVTRWEVVDKVAVFNFFIDNDDLRELLVGLASKASRAGVVVPGTKKIEEKVVA